MNAKSFRILSLAAAALGALALSAHADTPGRYYRESGRGGYYRYHHRDGGYRDYGRSYVSVGVGIVPEPYYGFYHHSSYYYANPEIPRGRPAYWVHAQSLESDVQRALAGRGYYGGAIDGEIGLQTRAAIRAYQVDRGLPVTGRIDRNLVISLNLI